MSAAAPPPPPRGPVPVFMDFFVTLVDPNVVGENGRPRQTTHRMRFPMDNIWMNFHVSPPPHPPGQQNPENPEIPLPQPEEQQQPPEQPQAAGQNGFPQFFNMFFPFLFPFGANPAAGAGGFGMPGGMTFDEFLNMTFHAAPSRGPPPTSAKFLESLPTAKVLEPCDCTICHDELELHSEATELPCLHLFHQDCVLPWLKEHNTCPVCRYELPVDDPEEEKLRQSRMAERDAELRKRRWPCQFGQQHNGECVLLHPERAQCLLTLPACQHCFHHECLQSWVQVERHTAHSNFVPREPVPDSPSDWPEFHCPVCNEVCPAGSITVPLSSSPAESAESPESASNSESGAVSWEAIPAEEPTPNPDLVFFSPASLSGSADGSGMFQCCPQEPPVAPISNENPEPMDTSEDSEGSSAIVTSMEEE